MLDPESSMAAIPGSRKIPAIRQSTPARTLAERENIITRI